MASAADGSVSQPARPRSASRSCRESMVRQSAFDIAAASRSPGLGGRDGQRVIHRQRPSKRMVGTLLVLPDSISEYPPDGSTARRDFLRVKLHPQTVKIPTNRWERPRSLLPGRPNPRTVDWYSICSDAGITRTEVYYAARAKASRQPPSSGPRRLAAAIASGAGHFRFLPGELRPPRTSRPRFSAIRGTCAIQRTSARIRLSSSAFRASAFSRAPAGRVDNDAAQRHHVDSNLMMLNAGIWDSALNPGKERTQLSDRFEQVSGPVVQDLRGRP